ncbi:MAG: helix-turn-helix domain-containing protein [Kofleriaceae bacterium]
MANRKRPLENVGGPYPQEEFLLPKIARLMREDGEMTAAQMARALGVTEGAISQYEDPRTPLGEPVLRKYAKTLNFPNFESAMRCALNLLEQRRQHE